MCHWQQGNRKGRVMMKQPIKGTILCIFSLVAVVVSFLTGCHYDPAIRAIQQNGALRVGYASCAVSEDAPFVMANDTGLTAEPAANAAKSLDVGTELIRVKNSDAYDRLLSGSVDCVWNVLPPEKQMVSSVRTIETGIYYRQMVITPSESNITRLADVSGKVMAVVSGSDAQTELHNAAVMESSLKEIKVCASMQEVLTLLADGTAHCAAVDEPQALYAVSQGKQDIRFLETPIAENQLVIATRAEDGELCSRIADSYVKMVQNGDIKRLCRVHTDSDGLNTSLLKGGASESQGNSI